MLVEALPSRGVPLRRSITKIICQKKFRDQSVLFRITFTTRRLAPNKEAITYLQKGRTWLGLESFVLKWNNVHK